MTLIFVAVMFHIASAAAAPLADYAASGALSVMDLGASPPTIVATVSAAEAAATPWRFRAMGSSR